MREPIDCVGCVYSYYERDTNWWECKHAGFHFRAWDSRCTPGCPGYLDKEDLKLPCEEGYERD